MHIRHIIFISRTFSTIEFNYIFKKSKSQENLICKLIRLNSFIHQKLKSKKFSKRDIVNMSNRERTIKFKNIVDYFDLFTKKAFFY